jgi:pyrimidine operon attenuation protein/uracil phosphoribosyltransferase
MRVLLDKNDSRRGLRRLAGQVLERHQAARDLVLVGIRRGGVPIAHALADWITELEKVSVPLGTIDMTLYRDDAATTVANPRIGPSEIPVSIDQKCVLLVDDVAHTGRTVRAALDALLDYGRPRSIELAVLVDRGGRELPIQPDFSVKRVEITVDERIEVLSDPGGIQAFILPADAPSLHPTAR